MAWHWIPATAAALRWRAKCKNTCVPCIACTVEKPQLFKIIPESPFTAALLMTSLFLHGTPEFLSLYRNVAYHFVVRASHEHNDWSFHEIYVPVRKWFLTTGVSGILNNIPIFYIWFLSFFLCGLKMFVYKSVRMCIPRMDTAYWAKALRISFSCLNELSRNIMWKCKHT